MVDNGWVQKEIRLSARTRGIHLITDEICSQLPELASYSVGTAHIFLLHTSAGLALNESVEPEVRSDVARHLDRLVPENGGLYQHTYEGLDDMPAHIKSMLVGVSICVPVWDGGLRLGNWQGIYLCEFRNRGGPRRLVVTLNGSIRMNKTERVL